jgi:hypothetical protein
MPQPITQAQPPLEFIPPQFNPLVFKATQLLLPLGMKKWTAVSQVQATHVDRLAELYKQFQSQNVRFLIAFRHPSVDDPLCMAHLLLHLVPQVARQQQIPLQDFTHVHFMYDRGIPLWAGDWMGWLYSQLGGIPIQRGKVDRLGLRTARDLFANGQFPLVAAPEGATNGHGELISPLEPGVAQLSFWCVEDLLKAGRTETVFIVPISIQYHYLQPPWKALEALLNELEGLAGFKPSARDRTTSDFLRSVQEETNWSEREVQLYQRLYGLGEHILTVMETFYTQFYHQSFSTAPRLEQATSAASTAEPLTRRLQALLDVALRVAEQYFDLTPKGSVIDRCRRLEQAGWDWIYREDIENLESLSPLERSLADAIATEANLRMWHMRMVESFVAVTGMYVMEKPTVERFAETILLIWDLITRIQGGNPFRRPRLGKQTVQMTVGEPISVSDRWDTYQVSRRSAKQAVADLTQDLQTTLEKMIL